jgi:hypothetical protein
MNRALGGADKWSCESVGYDAAEDRLSFIGFAAKEIRMQVAAGGAEIGNFSLAAGSVAMTGLGAADELEKALSPESWTGGKAVKLAGSIVVEGLRATSADSLLSPWEDTPPLAAGVERAVLEGARLTDAAGGVPEGLAGYLSHLAFSRAALTGVTAEAEDGSVRIGLDAYEALEVAFGGSGPGGGAGAAVDMLDVMLSQSAASDRATGFRAFFASRDGESFQAAVSEIKTEKVLGAGAFGSYALTGFTAETSADGHSGGIRASLGALKSEGLDARKLIRRVRAAAAEAIALEDGRAIRKASTLGDLVSLPFSLGSLSLSDFSVKGKGLDAGFKSLSWKGPAEAGKIYDSSASLEGFFMAAPPADAPEWLREPGELARRLGIDAYRADLKLSRKRDPETGATTWAVDSLDAEGLFALTARISLTGVDQALADFLSAHYFTELDNLSSALPLLSSDEIMALGALGASVSYKDASLGSRLSRIAQQNGTSMDRLADMAENELRESGQNAGLALNPAFAEGMKAVFAGPGSFTVSFRPDKPVTVARAMAGAFSESGDLFRDVRKYYLSVDGGPETPFYQ